MAGGDKVIGLDLGTSGITALAVDSSGRITARASADYPLATPRPGWAEQDPADWRQALWHVLGELGDGDVAALGASGQMHSAVLLDSADAVVRPAILWCDGRTSAQCRWLTDELGLDGLRRHVQNRAYEGFTLPKLLWLRDHEPRSLERTRRLLLPKDYAVLQLSGANSTDVSDASGTLLYDVAAGQWSAHLLELTRLPADMMPPVNESATPVGQVRAHVAAELGLPSVPVVAGGADNACAALGAGIVAPGQVLVSIGTSGTVVAPTAGSDVDPAMRLHYFRHAVAGLRYHMGVMLSAGGSLRWYRDLVGGGGYDALLVRLTERGPRPDDPYFLPYLSGERTPHADADARGALVGLSLAHDRTDVTRAVVEGISFGLKDSLRLLGELGVEIADVRVTGGGSTSPAWMQLLSDVLDVPLTPVTAEGPAYGAAMLAAVAAGWQTSVLAVATSWTSPALATARRFEPDAAHAAAYAVRYERFRSLYPALHRATR